MQIMIEFMLTIKSHENQFNNRRAHFRLLPMQNIWLRVLLCDAVQVSFVYI